MTEIIASPVLSPPAEKQEATAPTLSELQAAFQRAVILGDDDILNDILDNSRTNRGVLFGGDGAFVFEDRPRPALAKPERAMVFA